MYRLDRDAVSGSGLGIDIGGARHRATGVFSHHVTTGAAGCLVRKASRARASRRGKDHQGCRCDQGRDAKFHVPSRVRWFARFARSDTASVATTLEANATVRHADRRGGGPYRVRTGDLLRATQARYQLRQQPICAGWRGGQIDASMPRSTRRASAFPRASSSGWWLCRVRRRLFHDEWSAHFQCSPA